MNVTVYFATNRVVTDPSTVTGFGTAMIPPSKPEAMLYGTAFVTGIDLASAAQGSVESIMETSQGGFPPAALADLSASGRNLLVFIHGFDNSFSDAITRAAYNAAWLAGSGTPAADMTVIAFSWPSRGRIVDLPVLTDDYLSDQQIAEQSGYHLMSFLATLAPIIRDAARGRGGSKAILLAHSMGGLALQYAIESWFLNRQPRDVIFDQAILAAADCPYDAFNRPNLARLSGLGLLATRVSIYYSDIDQVLGLSMAVNLGAQRLGQDGPRGRSDAASFPLMQYSMTDCSAYDDYAVDFLTSHQYYRQSPAVRKLIASSL